MDIKGVAVFAALGLFGITSAMAAGETPAPAAPAAADSGKLMLQLNNAQPADKSCTVTFVVVNHSSTAIQSSTFIMSLFDTAGQIIKPVNMKFPAFPVGKPKVIQFPLDLTCDKISGIVPNATECVDSSNAPSTVCDDAVMSSKASIQFPLNIE